MIRKISSLLLCTSIVFTAYFCLPLFAFAYSAQSFVLLDPDSGKVLCGDNIYQKRSMASTTKIMTALLLCESGELNRIVTVNEKAVLVEGTSIGLRAKDKIPRENLLYGLMLESGNDAANAIAFELGGNIKNFAKMMNERAKQIGMTRSHFVTPSGLDDDEHYTCSFDMALLAAAAMKNDEFRKAVSTKSYKSVYNNESSYRTYSNHNRLLSSLEGAEGIKTGFTKKSGRCLVSACSRMNKRLIAVTLNAPDDWNDHAALYNYGFSLYETVTLNAKLNLKPLSVGGGKNAKVSLYYEPVDVVMLKDFASRADYVVELPQFVYAPVLCGDTVGYINYYCNGKIIAKAEIKAEYSVNKTDEKCSFFDKMMNWLQILIKLG